MKIQSMKSMIFVLLLLSNCKSRTFGKINQETIESSKSNFSVNKNKLEIAEIITMYKSGNWKEFQSKILYSEQQTIVANARAVLASAFPTPKYKDNLESAITEVEKNRSEKESPQVNQILSIYRLACHLTHFFHINSPYAQPTPNCRAEIEITDDIAKWKQFAMESLERHHWLLPTSKDLTIAEFINLSPYPIWPVGFTVKQLSPGDVFYVSPFDFYAHDLNHSLGTRTMPAWNEFWSLKTPSKQEILQIVLNREKFLVKIKNVLNDSSLSLQEQKLAELIVFDFFHEYSVGDFQKQTDKGYSTSSSKNFAVYLNLILKNRDDLGVWNIASNDKFEISPISTLNFGIAGSKNDFGDSPEEIKSAREKLVTLFLKATGN